jgi:hypothetical protein
MLVSGALLLCIVQSALTFSRSGLYSAFGSFAVGLVFLLQDARIRRRLTGLGIVGALVIVFGVIPYLVAFTGGMISKRFSSVKMTGREEIAMMDLDLWKKNPVFGVGVGISTWYHPGGLPSHNELSRTVAEHGLLGLLALLTLTAYGVHRLMLARSVIDKAFVAIAFAWPLLFMLTNGFRIAAPAFVLGLGCVTLSDSVPRGIMRRNRYAPPPEAHQIV